MMLPRIFVGGTGRSGTWVLYRALGSHKKVHVFPAETRFMIDPDGLFDLVDALTTRYAPVKAREAIHRFERWMRLYAATPGQVPYAMLDFPEWMGGEDYYHQQLDAFLDALSSGNMDSNLVRHFEHENRLVVLAKRVSEGLGRGGTQALMPEYSRQNMKVGRYFADRQELLRLAGDFVDNIFSAAAEMQGKETWCEKTPQHLLYLNELWEMFPNSAFIHIKRDPRGVAQSLDKQRWGPCGLESSAEFLKAVYDRWFDLRETLDLENQRYYEVKLEEMAVDTDRHLSNIAALCDLEDDFPDRPKVELKKVDYWKESMSAAEVGLVNDILGDRIERMGYER